MAEFDSLYSYNIEGGVVLPQTSDIKNSVENAFKNIFGSDFSTDESSINGRLIEAITLMFVDVCGVNAQNANGMNVERAVGLFLDNLGSAYGVYRNPGETDYSYRKRIIESYSRGSGFASSIRNAISLVDGVTNVVVLDNGYEDPTSQPLSNSGEVLAHSIVVKPHSVFVSVIGGDNTEIAKAIRSSKSAGCGFEDSTSYGTVVSQLINDSDTGTSFTAKFYRPSERYVRIAVSVSNISYTGTDIVSDATNAIKDLIASNSINATVTKSMIVAALASSGKNIVGTSTAIYVSDANSVPTSAEEVDQIVIPAYKYVNSSNITVTVNLV